MRGKIITFLVLFVIATSAVSALLWFRGRDDRAWTGAQQADLAESYEAFLREYPGSPFTPAAKEALAACRERTRWKEVSESSKVAELRTFITEFALSAHVSDARRRLKTALLMESARAWMERQKECSQRTLEDIVESVMAAERERPKSNEDYRIVLDVLAEFVANADTELFRVSFSDVKPDSGGDCVRLGAYAMATGLLVSGHVRGGGSDLTIKGSIIPPNGRLNGAIELAEGSCLMLDVASRRRNFAGNIAITSGQAEQGVGLPATLGVGACKAFTELPDEWVFYKMGDFRGMNQEDSGILIPNGRGTIIRFKGRVQNFFEGFTIHGDDSYPLAFVLLDQAGLTYLCGKGTVTAPDGKTWSLPES